MGRVPGGGAWVVQEFIDGRTPLRLDDFVAEQMTGILGLQEAMFPGAVGGWEQWAAGVVFEDWHGLRDRVASGVPGGSRIVAAVDAIAGACSPGPLSGQDLVHGNFNLANTIVTPGRLWVVDGEALGAGPCTYDLAEALLVAAGPGHVTESAAARLWVYAAGLDRREFEVCAGSVGLTMAESFLDTAAPARRPARSPEWCGPWNKPCPSPAPDRGSTGPGPVNQLQLPHAARTIWLWGLTRPRSRAFAR